ncbi:MAG: DUF452 family protein [Muribaculaceae bacterium]|nr:DUF452 family protein [Muribaculaceae bacterium]
MKTDFIFRSPSSSRLILIFAGWSTGPELYSGIHRKGWDVAVCHGYGDFLIPEGILGPYETVIVYAWSFGVFAAMRALRGKRVTSAYALNGTGCPVDAERGIDPAIFKGTLEGLSLLSLTKFRRRMAGSAAGMGNLGKHLDPAPDIEVLRSELAAIEKEYINVRKEEIDDTLPWRRVFISTDDRIIPYESQLRFWKQHPSAPEIVTLPGAHYFPLQDVVNATLPAPEKVGRRFEAALDTYDSHARAQRVIAARLAGLIPGEARREGDILEIGAGCGMLTQMYAPLLRPASATFVDLYTPRAPFDIAERETYVSMDAEQWMDSAPAEAYDVILSASTIQWFTDPERFLSNAYRALRPGGFLAVSTFVEGNLHELDAARPSPLPYLKASGFEEMAARIFGPDNTETLSEEVRLTFATPREALLHLKLTGVGGSASGTPAIRNLLRALTPENAGASPALTFRPLYLVARKL